MTRALILEPEAEADLAEVRSRYNRQRSGLGDEFIACVEEKLRRIHATPETHSMVYRDVRRIALRRFPYVFYYRIEADAVVVLAVVHNRRDPRSWQNRV